jgi:hypothetical protein
MSFCFGYIPLHSLSPLLRNTRTFEPIQPLSLPLSFSLALFISLSAISARCTQSIPSPPTYYTSHHPPTYSLSSSPIQQADQSIPVPDWGLEQRYNLGELVLHLTYRVNLPSRGLGAIRRETSRQSL